MPVEVKPDETVTMTHPSGASAHILLYGATVVSWKCRTKGSSADSEVKERLWVSALASLEGMRPVRGGIPIIFPFFGPPGRQEYEHLAQHGYARTANWDFGETVLDNDEAVSVRIDLVPGPLVDPGGNWKVEYTVTLTEHEIKSDLYVRNGPVKPWHIQALFHTFYPAPVASARVTPLQGLTYIDKTKGGAESVEERDAVDAPVFTDRIYKDAGGEYQIRWEGGGVDVHTTGFKDVVVWNPAERNGRKMGDMEEGGWERFICVEPGTVASWMELAPDAEWRGQQVITAVI